MDRRWRLGIAMAAAVGLAGGCNDTETMQVPDEEDIGQPSLDMAVAADLARAPDMANPCGPCAPPKPVCDARNRRCVACLVDGDCPPASVCKNASCVTGCSPQHAECGDAGSCDVDMGRCHGCLADADCRDPAAPFCDPILGR